MTNNHASSPPPDHHSAGAIASIWLLVLALIGVMEIGSLLMSRTMLAAILQ